MRKKDLMHEISCMMINIARMQGGIYGKTIWRELRKEKTVRNIDRKRRIMPQDENMCYTTMECMHTALERTV